MKKKSAKEEAETKPEGLFARVYRLVNTIPPGKVTTYGTIARVLGNPRLSRRVGFAMASLPQGSTVPWHRVLGKNGITVPPPYNAIQKALLTKEKVRFDKSGRPLEKYFHLF